MALGRTDGRNDSLTHAGKHGLLAGSSDQLVDIGAHGHPRLADELDAVFGDRRHRWRIDDLRVHGHLHRLENVTPCQVDAGGSLEIEGDIGLVR